MFIIKKKVKLYCKDKKRRVSKEFILFLDRQVQETLDKWMAANSKITLRP